MSPGCPVGRPGGRSGLGAGAVGGAGLQGTGGDRGRRAGAGVKRVRCGGMRVAQAKRLKRLEGENARLRRALAVSERRACRVLGQPRLHPALACSCTGQQGRRLGAAIVGLATSFGRYGYRRVAALPLGLGAGRSTTSGRGRIWRQEGLKVPRRQPKTRPSVADRRVPCCVQRIVYPTNGQMLAVVEGQSTGAATRSSGCTRRDQRSNASSAG